MSAPAPTARYTASADALVDGLMRGTAAARARTRRRYVAYGLVSAALAAFYHVAAGVDSLYFLLLATLFLGLAAARPWLSRRQLRAHVAGRQDLGRTVTVQIAGGDLRVETDGVGYAVQRLDTLHAVETWPEGVLVQPYPNEYQWIPAAAFATPAERAAFERALLAGAPLPAAAL